MSEIERIRCGWGRRGAEAAPLQAGESCQTELASTSTFVLASTSPVPWDSVIQTAQMIG